MNLCVGIEDCKQLNVTKQLNTIKKQPPATSKDNIKAP